MQYVREDNAYVFRKCLILLLPFSHCVLQLDVRA